MFEMIEEIAARAAPGHAVLWAPGIVIVIDDPHIDPPGVRRADDPRAKPIPFALTRKGWEHGRS